MNTQKAVKWFGIVLLVVGILGFIPGITKSGMLLGIFQVDTLHNVIHLLTGIIALFCAGSVSLAKTYFKIFGVVYALVAILGIVGSGTVLSMMMNGADDILHVLIAIIALVLGFGGAKKMQMPAPQEQMMQ